MKNTITPEEHARIKRRRWRQTLGLLITVLVLIGFITVLRAGVGLVANLFDDTAQKQEYEDKLEGLVLFDPMPFDGIENIDDLTLREAAVWGCVYSIQETQGGFENYNTDPETEQLLLPSVEVDAYLANPWCTFRFTVNAYYHMFCGIQYAQKKENIKKIPKDLPLYLVAGAEDPVGNFGKSVENVAKIYQECGIKDVSLKLYEKDRHEILNELDRQVVYEDILAWVEAHLI